VKERAEVKKVADTFISAQRPYRKKRGGRGGPRMGMENRKIPTNWLPRVVATDILELLRRREGGKRSVEKKEEQTSKSTPWKVPEVGNSAQDGGGGNGTWVGANVIQLSLSHLAEAKGKESSGGFRVK